MIAFPHCKINLGLYITGKRTDGYHNVDTVFFPVPLYDILEFVPAREHQFSLTGLPVIGLSADNLCQKAYDLLKALHPTLPPLHIHLHKLIPMGAGLGGGSADGAFMLSMLNTYFSLGYTAKELMSLALQLGSDCPYFLLNTPAHGTGRGEILNPVALSLSSWWLTLVNPGIHVSTKTAFAGITPRPGPGDLAGEIAGPVENWKNWLRNDFEPGVFESYPAIGALKHSLYEAGAVYASMTGSGSTVFGLFKQKTDIKFPSNYLVKTVQIK